MKKLTLGECLDTLPVGLLGEDDKVFRSFKLGSVTGRVRLELGKGNLGDNAGKLVTKLLYLTVQEIGNEAGTLEATFQRLSFIDRDYLQWLLYLQRVGDGTIDIEVTCATDGCGIEIEADIRPHALEVRVLEEGDWEVEDVREKDDPDAAGENLTGKLRLFRFEHEEHGTLRVQLLTGADEERTAVAWQKNKEEASLRDLHCAVYDFQGETLTFDQFLDLSERTLNWMRAATDAIQLGVTNVVNVSCPDCGGETPDVISPFDLLRISRVEEVEPPYLMRSSS